MSSPSPSTSTLPPRSGLVLRLGFAGRKELTDPEQRIVADSLNHVMQTLATRLSSIAPGTPVEAGKEPPDSEWADAQAPLCGITPIIDFIAAAYGKRFAPNTRETIRDDAVTFIMKLEIAKRIFSFAVAALVFSSILSGEEHSKFEIPMNLEELIDEALEIKKEAMGYPGMHHDELVAGDGFRAGVSGKRFQNVMERISDFPTMDKMINAAEMFQHEDIRAKIMIFALGRKNRRNDYERFEKYYVNRPKDEEIIEYFYFAPRVREAFDNDLVRSHLSQSLINLGNVDRSLVVWQSDLSIALQVPVEKLERNRGAGWNVYVSVWPLVRMETKEAYQVLAGHWGNKQAREAIEWQLRQSWWPLKPQPLDMSRYEEASKRHGAWTAMARETWETPNEKSFAAWLLEQPAPPIPDR